MQTHALAVELCVLEKDKEDGGSVVLDLECVREICHSIQQQSLLEVSAVPCLALFVFFHAMLCYAGMGTSINIFISLYE